MRISKKRTSPAQEVLLRFSDRRCSRPGILAASLLLLPIAAITGSKASEVMFGYSSSAANEERAVEQQFRALTSTDQISKFHRYLTAEPHPAGSQRNNDLARWVADQWREQGLEDVTIHEYDGSILLRARFRSK